MAKQLEVATRVASVLEDPSTAAVARLYANAFLSALPADQTAQTLEEIQSFLDDVLARNPDFEQLLTSSEIGRDDKLRLIDRVVAGRGSELFTNFLRVLARHDRLDVLALVLKQCALQFELRSGKRRVRVTSAHALSEAALAKVSQRLRETFPFEPVLEPEVDPSLLGGLRIRVGDTVYDGSLQARLRQLKTRLRDRSLHEIQSGRDRFSHPERD